jgi:hypothetical protein
MTEIPMRSRAQFLRVLLLLILVPIIVLAQGKIRGRVIDKDTKEPLVGANVIVVGTTYGAASGFDGEFLILNVPVGTFTIRVSYVGYSAYAVENVRVNFELTTEVLVELTSVQISMAPVVIVAERPLVNKNATNAVRIVTSDDMQSMPARGVDNILALQAGVVQQDRQTFIRAGRVDEVGFQVDGVSIADPQYGGRRMTIAQDAVEEISLQSAGYEAEYGRANAGIVQYVLKTGGSAFKGSLEYITDNIGFQSKSTAYDGKKHLGAYWYGYNQFTGTVSGPVFDNRFKIFGLFDYNYQRDRRPQAYAGVTVGPVKDPSTGDSINVVYPAGLIINNSDERYTYTGTFTADLLPLKIKFSGSYTHIQSFLGRSPTAILNLNRTPEQNTWDGFGSIKATYIVAPTIFLEVTGGLFKNYQKQYDSALKDDFMGYADSVANAQVGYVWNRRSGDAVGRFYGPRAYIVYGYSFEAPGTPSYYYLKLQRDNSSFNAALTAQIGNHHSFKIGGDYMRFTIRTYENTPSGPLRRLIQANDTLPAGDPNKQTLDQIMIWWGVNNYGYDFTGSSTDRNDFLGPRHPVFASGYVQDKMEFDDLVINAGLRFDYIDAAAYQFLDPTRPELAIDAATGAIDPAGLELTKPFRAVSPRFGAAFSFTDKTVFHVQYAKLIQQSRLRDLNLGWYAYGWSVVSSSSSRPIAYNLQPTRTTQYEVGFTQQLGDFASLDATGYYKDVMDQTRWALMQTATGSSFVPYPYFLNADYATTKGIELSFHMRRVNRIQANASLTFQDGEGTGAYTNSAMHAAVAGSQQELIAPLDYNNKIRSSLLVDYRFGHADGGTILQDLGASLLFTFSSGHPYTRWLNEANNQFRVEALNSSTTPSWFQADLRVEKTFRLPNNVGATVYLFVINLFDARNVENVYPQTGSASDNGYLTQPDGGAKLVGSYGPVYSDLYRQISLGYGRIDYLSESAAVYRYGPPRQIRIGLRLEYQ